MPRPGNEESLMIIGIFVILYITFTRIYEAFLISVRPISEIIYSQALAFTISDIIIYIVFVLMLHHWPTVLPLLVILILQMILSSIWSFLCNKWYFYVQAPKKTAIIYDQNNMEGLIDKYGLDKSFDVQYISRMKDCLDSIHILDSMETVFLCDIHSHGRHEILKYCIEQNINVYVIPRLGDVIMSSAKPMHLFHLPILRIDGYEPKPEYVICKRLFDILVSGCAVFLLSPIMLITACAIKLYDRGPVLYKQKRLTQNGKEFYVLKFRSMIQNAEANGIARLSNGDNDPRVTPVGKYIRKYRIDELPQLFNILSGSMSIVGPRPERPEIAAQYEEIIPEFHLRLKAKAGLTGYAQVYGQYNTEPYDKLRMDLMYIARQSMLEDFKLCFATVKILFRTDSTEGIQAGQTTALRTKKNKQPQTSVKTTKTELNL